MLIICRGRPIRILLALMRQHGDDGDGDVQHQEDQPLRIDDLSYEEFTWLTETRLAQNNLKNVKIAYLNIALNTLKIMR